MSNILDRILATKAGELVQRKAQRSQADLESALAHASMTDPRGFVAALRRQAEQKQPGVIAEIKKASPSAGIISEDFDPVTKAKEYELFGASALSILTEEDYFLGSIKYLKDVKAISNLPILRKDFVIDEYQIYESKLIGTDPKSILKETGTLLTNKKAYQKMSKAFNPFGDGKASIRILKTCEEFLAKER